MNSMARQDSGAGEAEVHSRNRSRQPRAAVWTKTALIAAILVMLCLLGMTRPVSSSLGAAAPEATTSGSTADFQADERPGPRAEPGLVQDFAPAAESRLPLPTGYDPEPVKKFLPLVLRFHPAKPASVGTQMFAVDASRGLGWAMAAGIQWVRFDAFNWAKIEPVRTQPPTYNWGAVDETSLRNASSSHFKTIAIVRGTPEWAQKLPGYSCGPIKPEELGAFAEFLGALVARYGVAPYGIRHWELGNEPDVDPSLVGGNSPYGCWGDAADYYYGGGYYATMLGAAYPAIKAVDPEAQVLLGGLLLSCDPTVGLGEPVPAAPAEDGAGATLECAPEPGRFLEGILASGGGAYFDIVSFHGYPPFDGSLQQDLTYSNWDGRGGVVMGKLDFLREVLTTYSLDKPVMHTEGALICPEWSPTLCSDPVPAFYEAQADYVVWLYLRNWAAGVKATVWYTWEGPGWRYSGLLDENQDPKPAYWALDFLTNELARSSYTGTVSLYPELKGYEFSVTGKRVWVLWAQDEVPHSVTLPLGTVRVFDKYGTDVTPPGADISISSPVYVELIP